MPFVCSGAVPIALSAINSRRINPTAVVNMLLAARIATKESVVEKRCRGGVDRIRRGAPHNIPIAGTVIVALGEEAGP